MLISFIFYATLVTTALLGFFVFTRNIRNSNNILFLLTCLSFSIWMVCNFLIDSVKTPELSVLFAKSDFAFGGIFSYIFLLFCQSFPNGGLKPKKIFLFSLVPIIVFIIAYATNFLITGAKVLENGNGYEITYGILEIPYYLFIVSYLFFGGLGSSISKYRKAEGLEKSQLLYVIIGFFFLLLIILGVNISFPYIFSDNPALTRFGYFGVVVWAFFTSYAIIKKHLFDIKVILTETAAVLVVAAIAVQIFLTNSFNQKIISGIVLLFVIYGAYLIIKSVQDEIMKKEQLQILSTQLGEANLHLKDLDKMKTEFVSLASHELLTPVSAIEGYLSMMLDEKLVKIEDPKAVQYMDRVYRSAKRLARLISDMLNISRIEEGRLLVEKQDVNMVEVIQQVIEELKFKADEHKQKIVFQNDKFPISNFQSNSNVKNLNVKTETDGKLKTDNGQPAFMTFADPDKVKEILVNIIGNAIKYTLTPGIITVTIEKAPTKVLTDEWGKLESVILASPVDDQESIHAVDDENMKQIVGDKQYLVRVKDQGVGIPKEELTKLFKKFHRVGNYSTQESQGTGLGLYITRALVELHHGRIWPDSEGMGKGSTFTFSLPTIEAKQAIVDLEAQSPQNKEQLKPLAKPMGNDDEL